MKEVMISIKPEWCKKILSGEKTLEIRKSHPDTETPFRCYIYCTYGGENWFSWGQQMSGHVIGEFVCDNIQVFGVPYPAYQKELPCEILEQSQVTYYALHRYALASNDCNLHGWHISNLEVYKKPIYISGNFLNRNGDAMSRPPQSWCYVIKRRQ